MMRIDVWDKFIREHDSFMVFPLNLSDCGFEVNDNLSGIFSFSMSRSDYEEHRVGMESKMLESGRPVQEKFTEADIRLLKRIGVEIKG